MIFVALQQHLMVNTDEEKTMSEMMTRLLERLAEMFPDSVYQSTLDAYIASRRPCDVFDVAGNNFKISLTKIPESTSYTSTQCESCNDRCGQIGRTLCGSNG